MSLSVAETWSYPLPHPFPWRPPACNEWAGKLPDKSAIRKSIIGNSQPCKMHSRTMPAHLGSISFNPERESPGYRRAHSAGRCRGQGPRQAPHHHCRQVNRQTTSFWLRPRQSCTSKGCGPLKYMCIFHIFRESGFLSIKGDLQEKMNLFLFHKKLLLKIQF